MFGPVQFFLCTENNLTRIQIQLKNFAVKVLPLLSEVDESH